MIWQFLFGRLIYSLGRRNARQLKSAKNAPEHNLLNSTSIFSAAPVMKNLSRFELRAGQA